MHPASKISPWILTSNLKSSRLHDTYIKALPFPHLEITHFFNPYLAKKLTQELLKEPFEEKKS